MLQKLGMHSVTVQYSTWPKAHRLEGPLLRDVLKAVGATGKTATVYALDGYGAKIPMTDLAAYPVVLALKSDGQWLGIGVRGPASSEEHTSELQSLMRISYAVYCLKIKH